MDIPNSGAIFTLGKSHLAENTQSYFYIKNDPVKRLISGPHQSAVICESGRLFVWGENHHGQLGIGSSSSNNGNNNNSNGNNDVVTKPTCVKSLKTLGLKVDDVAFGNDWAVILAHSNELFFTGRNIFLTDTNVSKNFSEAEVDGEHCAIIRKPFRLEEFDDCLSNSEEAESFVTVLAGNEHFAVMTSFGRLIGWGSNMSNQLGFINNSDNNEPFEIVLDAPIQQFTCGPESTLVLTESGNLYLTGKLNEFVFAQFTELQKNLSSNEEIIFMHISKASEIYIVTNAGSIYRSIESVRNKSLIFQRFYDYDSEENGPIWKLLKGSSFFIVLTKANKFYTTFSESGHHLKTFREISKFKNLRLLDIAVGDQHILVHGIPRSSTLSATVGANGEHRFMSRSFVMTPAELNGNVRGRSGKNLTKQKIVEEAETTNEVENNVDTLERKETPKPNTPIHQNGEVDDEENDRDLSSTNIPKVEAIIDKNGNKEEDLHTEVIESMDVIVDKLNDTANSITESKILTQQTFEDNFENSKNTKINSNRNSPTGSVKSRKSARSIKFDKQTASLTKSVSSEKLLRPRTPYPESSPGSTPQTAKKTIRNFSYEAAMEHDAIENTTPALHDSLENISESEVDVTPVNTFRATIHTPTPPYEEDEELTVEIETTTNSLDQTVVNEIRFINNGIDVTPAAATKSLEKVDTIENLLEESAKDINDEAKGLIEKVGDKLEVKALAAVELKNDVEQEIKETKETIGDKVEEKFNKAVESMGTAAHKVATGARGAMDTVGTNAKKAASGAMEAADSVGTNVKKAASDAGHTMGSLGSRAMGAASDAGHTMGSLGSRAMGAASDAGHSMGSLGSRAMGAASDAKNAMGNALYKVADDTKNAVDSMATKISTEVNDAKENISSLLQGNKTNSKTTDAHDDTEDVVSSESTSKGGLKTIIGDDDERTTASVNSNHTSAGNPFESSNNPFDYELDQVVEHSYQSGKNALRDELEHETEKGKGKMRQFFDDIKSKSKGLSCKSEKAIRIEDEPPRYTPVEAPTQMHGASSQHNNGNTSKVCTIL